MNVARLLYPVKVLGPGNRMGIWFAGCTHGCHGCSNPELWKKKPEYETGCDTIMKMIKSVARTGKIDGFTLTGGEPFQQQEALRELLPHLADISDDILVYTGFEYDEDFRRENADILSYVTVLIDGRYIRERNRNCFLRGSDNQRISILQDRHRERYLKYIREGHNQVQNFRTGNGFISVGIHGADYEKELKKRLLEKGLTGQDNGQS